MTIKNYLILSGITLCIGMIFYGLYNDLIIIHLPIKKGAVAINLGSAKSKTIKLAYPQGDELLIEEKEIVITNNLQRTLNDVIHSWLSLLEEEQLLQKKATIQSILLDTSGTEAFISFDRNILEKNQSAYHKLLLVESLLKTLRENDILLKTVRLLVNSKPLNDPHLDFSHSWPITGYLAS